MAHRVVSPCISHLNYCNIVLTSQVLTSHRTSTMMTLYCTWRWAGRASAPPVQNLAPSAPHTGAHISI